MVTIRNLIDRCYREYLEPNDDLTSYTALTSSINSSVTTVPCNANLLTKDEGYRISGIPVNSMIEEIAYHVGQTLKEAA